VYHARQSLAANALTHSQSTPSTPPQASTMISDASLYSLAVFLGSAAMLLIVLYHFLEINAKEDSKVATPLSSDRKADAIPQKAR